jgi:hypothetical protein
MQMEIRSTGFEMAELPPGVEKLSVVPDGSSEFGVEVLIKFGDQEVMSYGVREFAELLAAINAMAAFVRSLAQQYATDSADLNKIDL